MKRGLALFLAALLAALTLTGCGGSAGGMSASGGDSGSTSASSSEAPADYEDYGEAQTWGFDDAAAETPAAPEEGGDRLANAKMVYTASIEAETQDYGACSAALEALVEQMGGYLEYASTGSYGDGSRSGSYTVRIPARQFKPFLKSVGEIGHVISQDQSSDNISERYYDTESRLTTQKTKLERLQTLLAKAENMEDIITLESAIAETELEIEQLTGSLRHYDSLVDYATVNVNLREVLRLSTVEEAPPTFASRLGNAFTDGLRGFGEFLQGLAIFLAYNWTWILVLAVIAIAVIRVSKRKQAQRMGTFREARERGSGFFGRKKAKNPDDKQEKD